MLFAVPVQDFVYHASLQHRHLQFLCDLAKIAEQFHGSARIQAICPTAHVKWVRISHTESSVGLPQWALAWDSTGSLLLLLLYSKYDLKNLRKFFFYSHSLLSPFLFFFFFSLKERKSALIPEQNTNLKYQSQTCRPEQMLTTYRAIASGYI